MANITITRLTDDSREQFILDNQRAFRYDAMEKFGERDSHYEMISILEMSFRKISFPPPGME